jgi:hypothetical protein
VRQPNSSLAFSLPLQALQETGKDKKYEVGTKTVSSSFVSKTTFRSPMCTTLPSQEWSFKVENNPYCDPY